MCGGLKVEASLLDKKDELVKYVYRYSGSNEEVIDR